MPQTWNYYGSQRLARWSDLLTQATVSDCLFPLSHSPSILGGHVQWRRPAAGMKFRPLSERTFGCAIMFYHIPLWVLSFYRTFQAYFHWLIFLGGLWNHLCWDLDLILLRFWLSGPICEGRATWKQKRTQSSVSGHLCWHPIPPSQEGPSSFWSLSGFWHSWPLPASWTMQSPMLWALWLHLSLVFLLSLWLLPHGSLCSSSSAWPLHVGVVQGLVLGDTSHHAYGFGSLLSLDHTCLLSSKPAFFMEDFAFFIEDFVALPGYPWHHRLNSSKTHPSLPKFVSPNPPLPPFNSSVSHHRIWCYSLLSILGRNWGIILDRSSPSSNPSLSPVVPKF